LGSGVGFLAGGLEKNAIGVLDARLAQHTRIRTQVPNYVPVMAIPQADARRWSDQWPLARMPRRAQSACDNQKGRMAMKNPLESIWGTIICGLVLTVILYLAVKNFLM
jgi:hypothetical protein